MSKNKTSKKLSKLKEIKKSSNFAFKVPEVLYQRMKKDEPPLQLKKAYSPLGRHWVSEHMHSTPCHSLQWSLWAGPLPPTSSCWCSPAVSHPGSVLSSSGPSVLTSYLEPSAWLRFSLPSNDISSISFWEQWNVLLEWLLEVLLEWHIQIGEWSNKREVNHFNYMLAGQALQV